MREPVEPNLAGGASGRPRPAERDGVAGILPHGVGPPADVPPTVFLAALETFLQQRRLDMGALAAELRISRSSLYRKVRSRDHLLSAVLAHLTRRAIVRALDAAAGLTGADRVVAVVSHLLHDVHSQASLRHLLREEPEVALRLLTSKSGMVQRCVIDALERLLAEEEAHAPMDLTLDRSTLAYVIVRIGESFLYADVIADNQPDVDQAVEVIARLMGTASPRTPPRPPRTRQRQVAASRGV